MAEKDLFRRRASVRKFLPEDVSGEAVRLLLEAAVEAPSGGNCQPWHFYVVRNAARRQQLCTAAWQQKFIAEAPVVLVVCAEPERSEKRYQQRGAQLYCLQDTAAAIENILLCATQLGLGACWCGAFDEETVREVMGLPPGRRPVSIIPVGKPSAEAKKPRRRPMEETVTFVD